MKLRDIIFSFLVFTSLSPNHHCLPQASRLDTGVEIRSVPAWAGSAVWYQIFPERFRNGDPSNDPKRSDLVGSWPHEYPVDWKVSSWTGDWYSLQPWELPQEKGFYVHAQHRRYGGDLQGVVDKLDYLKDLGITAIYFNPLFESPSLHKYDAALYHHIDNNFGPDPAGDVRIWNSENPEDPSSWRWTSADTLFLHLIREAHRRGMRVIIDGVFNHVGLNFWAFQDVMKKGEQSDYKDWFTIHQWDDPATGENEFRYEGWNGVRELPEVREDMDGLIQPFAEHVFKVVRRWMDPNGDGDPDDGIDGWRLDAAEMVGLPFWRKFREIVKGINPEAYLVGEVWWEDWKANKIFNAAPWLQGDVFDAVMNYRWAREAFLYFAAEKERISATELTGRLRSLLADYPPEVNPVLMNLYSSHDTDRFGSRIRNADLAYDHGAGVMDNKDYDVSKPDSRDRETQRLMILFQMTYPGAPTIYYGSEAGMWGADDPDCRKPMVWSDAAHEPERSHPFGKERRPDEVRFDSTLHDWYKRAIRFRRDHPSLSVGSIEFLATNDTINGMAYYRAAKEDEVLVVLNNGMESHTLEIRPPESLSSRRWVTGFGEGNFVVSGERLKVTLPAKSGIVLQAIL